MSTCSHGVPRFYRCSCDKEHPHPPEHKCDDGPVKMNSLDRVERDIVMALIAARDAPRTDKPVA